MRSLSFVPSTLSSSATVSGAHSSSSVLSGESFPENERGPCACGPITLAAGLVHDKSNGSSDISSRSSTVRVIRGCAAESGLYTGAANCMNSFPLFILSGDNLLGPVHHHFSRHIEDWSTATPVKNRSHWCGKATPSRRLP